MGASNDHNNKIIAINIGLYPIFLVYVLDAFTQAQCVWHDNVPLVLLYWFMLFGGLVFVHLWFFLWILFSTHLGYFQWICSASCKCCSYIPSRSGVEQTVLTLCVSVLMILYLALCDGYCATVNIDLHVWVSCIHLSLCSLQ